MTSFSELKYHQIKQIRSLDSLYDSNSSLKDKIHQVAPLFNKIFEISKKYYSNVLLERCEHAISKSKHVVQTGFNFGGYPKKVQNPYELLIRDLVEGVQRNNEISSLIQKIEQFKYENIDIPSPIFVTFLKELIESQTNEKKLTYNQSGPLMDIPLQLLSKYESLSMSIEKNSLNTNSICSYLKNSKIKILEIRGNIDLDQYIRLMSAVSHSIEELYLNINIEVFKIGKEVNIDFPNLKKLFGIEENKKNFHSFPNCINISSFFFNLSKLEKLEEIDFSEKPITKSFCELIKNTKNLKRIVLGSYKLPFFYDVEVEEFFESLAQNQTITNITFKFEKSKNYQSKTINDLSYVIDLKSDDTSLEMFFNSLEKIPTLECITLPKKTNNLKVLNDFLSKKQFKSLEISSTYDKKDITPLKSPLECLLFNCSKKRELNDIEEIFQPKKITFSEFLPIEFISKTKTEHIEISTFDEFEKLCEIINSNENIKKITLLSPQLENIIYGLSLIKRRVETTFQEHDQKFNSYPEFMERENPFNDKFHQNKNNLEVLFGIFEEPRCSSKGSHYNETPSKIPDYIKEKLKNGDVQSIINDL